MREHKFAFKDWQMKKLLIFFILFSFNSISNPLYGLRIDIYGNPAIVSDTLSITVNVSQLSSKASDSQEVQKILTDIELSADWINEQLGLKAVEINTITLYEKEAGKNFSCFDRENQETTLCYFPGEWKRTSKGPVEGHCLSVLSEYLTILKDPEIQDSAILIYEHFSDSGIQNSFFVRVVIHEILHALGFDHAREGVMIAKPTDFDFYEGNLDYIDPVQLSNWLKERNKRKLREVIYENAVNALYIFSILR